MLCASVQTRFALFINLLFSKMIALAEKAPAWKLGCRWHAGMALCSEAARAPAAPGVLLKFVFLHGAGAAAAAVVNYGSIKAACT